MQLSSCLLAAEQCIERGSMHRRKDRVPTNTINDVNIVLNNDILSKLVGKLGLWDAKCLLAFTLSDTPHRACNDRLGDSGRSV